MKQSIAALMVVVLSGLGTAPVATGQTITSAQILAESANVACLDYSIVGICIWLRCGFRGCRLRASVKVKHYIPDAVVSAYNVTGNSPWIETRSMAPPTVMAQDGGSNKEGSRVTNETALLFKNVDVLGSPGTLWIDALRSSGLYCNTSTTPLFPYMLSTLDPWWRDPTLESAWTAANIWRYVRLGGSTWAGVYPRIGFVHQGHDYKAGAVAAQRAADITTRNNQPHVYWPMLASGSAGQWPPGAVIEGDADTHRWQQLIPSSQARECRVFPDQSDQSAGALDPFQSRLSQITGYAFNLWRPYRCCRRAGQWLIFHTGH